MDFSSTQRSAISLLQSHVEKLNSYFVGRFYAYKQVSTAKFIFQVMPLYYHTPQFSAEHCHGNDCYHFCYYPSTLFQKSF